MQRLHMAAAGNADENINLIDHRFQAEALRALRGYDVGVLDNSFFDSGHKDGTARVPNQAFMWKLTAANILDIAVGRGMATAYGVDMKSEQTVHLTATAPSVGTKYIFVYLEWDLSNPVEGKGKIDIHDNGSSASWTPSRQDNLITNPIGVYQLPLYRMAVNTTGIISNITDWKALGVSTIGFPLRAEHATHTEMADDTKAVAGKPVSMDNAKDNLLHDGKIVCRKKYLWAGNAEYVSVGDTFTLSEPVKVGDTLEFEIDMHYIGSTQSNGTVYPARLKLAPVKAKVNAHSDHSDPVYCEVTHVSSGGSTNNGFSAGCTVFIFNGTTMTVRHKMLLLNFANNGGSIQQNNGLYLRSVAKIYEQV